MSGSLDALKAKVANSGDKVAAAIADTAPEGEAIGVTQITDVPAPAEGAQSEGGESLQSKAPPAEAILNAAESDEEFHVFYSTILSTRTVTDTGRVITFVNGKYITKIEEEIEFLQRQIASGVAYFYTKKGEEVVTASDLDPMAKLRKQFMSELMEKEKVIRQKIESGDLPESASIVSKLVPGNTKTAGATAADSVSSAE